MKRKNDWTDIVREALRDTELPPPASGWERLREELEHAGANAGDPAGAEVRRTPPIRLGRWHVAAAAVLACLVAGEFYRHAAPAVPESDLAEGAGAVSIPFAFADGGDSESSVPDSVRTAERSRSGNPLREGDLLSVRGMRTEGGTGGRGSGVSQDGAVSGLSEPTVDQGSFGNGPDSHPGGSDARTAFSDRSGSADDGRAAGNPDASDAEDNRAPDDGFRAKRTPAERSEGSSLRSDRMLLADASDRDLSARGTVSHRRTSFGMYGAGGFSHAAAGGLGARDMMVSDPLSDPRPWYSGCSMSPGFVPAKSLLERIDYRNASFRHHQPLGFGLTVRRALGHGVSIEGGVNYTLLRSDVYLPFGSRDLEQRLHFIGIPLRVDYAFLRRGAFLVYAGVGGTVEKCVSATLGPDRIDERALQWSVNAAAGAEYRLGGFVGLYFEPEVSAYLTDTKLCTPRTESPLTLTLRFGIRFSF